MISKEKQDADDTDIDVGLLRRHEEMRTAQILTALDWVDQAQDSKELQDRLKKVRKWFGKSFTEAVKRQYQERHPNGETS